jgi:plasmid maintenance system killer protein
MQVSVQENVYTEQQRQRNYQCYYNSPHHSDLSMLSASAANSSLLMLDPQEQLEAKL